MSQWYCKLAEGDLGPLEFKQLAAMAREGRISESARVRRAGATEWSPAWTVVGLFEAAPRQQDGMVAAPLTARAAESRETSLGNHRPLIATIETRRALERARKARLIFGAARVG